jgi:hypothetical protein
MRSRFPLAALGLALGLGCQHTPLTLSMQAPTIQYETAKPARQVATYIFQRWALVQDVAVDTVQTSDGYMVSMVHPTRGALGTVVISEVAGVTRVRYTEPLKGTPKAIGEVVSACR